MNRKFMIALGLMLLSPAYAGFTIKSRVDENAVASIKTRSALDFEKTISLKVGVDPKKVNPERRAKILNSLVIKDWYGDVVPAVDYDLDTDIAIAIQSGSAEILRTIKSGKYPKIVAVFRDKQGRLIKPDIRRIGASTLNGKPICLEINPIGQSQVSILVDLIIDKSGSMSSVMEETKHAARELVKRLPATAQCRIKAASSTTENLTPNGFTNCRTAIAAINPLFASGGTDIYTPLHQSYWYFSKELMRPSDEVDKSVIIITDGHVNQSLELLDRLKTLKEDTRTLVYYIGDSEDQYFKELSDAFVKGANQPTGEITNFLSAIGKSIEYQHVLTQKPCTTASNPTSP